MDLAAFIHHPRNFGCETDRGTLQQTAGKADSPGIYPFLDLSFAWRPGRILSSPGLRSTRIAKRYRNDEHSKQSCTKTHFKNALTTENTNEEYKHAWRWRRKTSVGKISNPPKVDQQTGTSPLQEVLN